MCSNCDHTFEHVKYHLDSAISALRLNYSPDPQDLDAYAIRRTIDAIDSRFERYDPEISRVQVILTTLRTYRSSLQTYRECCLSALSPIRRLPPEILQTIFIESMGLEPDVVPVVGQVCRYWREVATGTPRLWSDISIGRTRFVFTQRYRELASLFLERSVNGPLSISIRNPADMRLMALVTGQAHRWSALRLSSIDRPFYDSLGLDKRFMPMLEKLKIVEPLSEPMGSESPIRIGFNAPRLRDVVLKNPLETWSLPWKQLTRLQYDVHSVADAVRVLYLCPQLEECSFDKMKEPMETQPPMLRPSLDLRALRLAVDISSAEAIMKTFFDCLTAPNLVSLEMVGQWSPDDFKEFLTRSECELEKLSLSTGYMKDDKIIDLLESLPLLDTLVLDADKGTSRQLQNRGVITDKLLRRLIFYPDSDCMLPSLTHLTLKTAVNFEDQVLLDVIESRWIPWVTELYGVPVSRLTHVDLNFCGRKDKLHSASIEELRELAAAGLQISLQQGLETISMAQPADDASSATQNDWFMSQLTRLNELSSS
ncbi:hypothetical protein B0H19DRAFT_1074806 [Mycena capillaripes]|nr:hypothetical protein B0H19DRAFT_1074806 [Mycena capillaripes]